MDVHHHHHRTHHAVADDAPLSGGAGPAALYPSPSGNFVACVWILRHHRYMIIYHCSSGFEADRGPCMLFGWIGGGGGDDDDSYLLKTPGHEKASEKVFVSTRISRCFMCCN